MRTPSYARKLGRAALAAAVAALFVGRADAASIGFNFVNNSTDDILQSTDAAGAPGYVQTNWNNSSTISPGAFNVFNGPVAALDSTGATVNLTVAWGAPNTWSTTNAYNTPDLKLMHGYLDSNNAGVAGTDLTQAASQPYVAVSGLPASMTTNKYRVVVYFNGDAALGRIGEYWLTSFGGNLADVSAETALTPHVFGKDTAVFSGTYTQVPISSTTGAAAVAGNYLVFDELTSPNFVLRAEEYTTGIATPRSLINAIQIYEIPLAVDTTWTAPGNGQWFNAGNWSAGIPNNTSDTARFLGSATAPATVTLDAAATVRGLVFDNANGYTISGSNALTINSNAGLSTVQVVSGNHAISTQLMVNTDTTFDIAASASLTLSNYIFAGTLPLTKTGAGTLTLTQPYSSWGNLIANAGTIRLGAADLIPYGSQISGTAGTLDLNGFSQSTIGRLNGGFNVINSGAGPVTLTVSPAAGADGAHTGTISGDISLIVNSGLQGLAGANSYTGTVTVNSGGTLRTQNPTALGTTTAGTTLNGGALSLWANDIGDEPITVTDFGGELQDRGRIGGPIALGTGALRVNANSGVAEPITLAGTITGNAGITKVGTQGVLLSGPNTFTGDVTVEVGWLGIGSDSTATTSPAGLGIVKLSTQGATTGLRTLGDHTLNNNIQAYGNFSIDPYTLAPITTPGVLTLAGTVDLGGVGRTITANSDAIITGKLTNGAINKDGPGTLTLANTANDFSGITLTAGKLSINDDAQLGALSQMLFQGGLLRVTGTTLASFTPARSATVDWTYFSGGFDIAEAAHTFTVSESIAGGGSLRKDGPGTLLLSGTNTYAGGTTLNAGTLKPTVAAALPDNGNLTVNGGTLDLNGFSKTIGTLAGTGGIITNSTATPITLTTGVGDGSGTFAGVLQNGSATTSLVKTGSGTLTLAGDQTYTGPTTVQTGTLRVNGSLANTAVTVGTGATLSGGGVIAGSVQVQTGGSLTPKSNLRVGQLNLASGTNLSFSITDPSIKDTVTVTSPNGLTVNGGAMTIVPIGLLFPGSYPLINYSGTLGGNVSNLSITNSTVGDTTYTVGHTPGSSIDLIIGTMLQTWKGTTDGNWDTTTANWTGASTTYVNGKPVRFDDTGTNTTINVAAAVSPSRIDIANSAATYTFSGANIGGAAALNKTGNGKAIFNQPLTHTGATKIAGGVVQLSGAATLNATSGILLGNEGSTPADTAYPIANARGGTLYLADDTTPDRTGTVPVTLKGGSIVLYKGPGGNGSATIQNVTADTGMGRLMTAPAGGTITLNIGNLTRTEPTSTVQFNSQYGTLGGTGDNGQIKISQLNGAAFSTANLTLGLIGPWATVGDAAAILTSGNNNFPNANFASYDDTVGVIGNVTNIQTALVDDPTANVRNTTGANLPAATASMTMNSLISSGDVIFPAGTTLTVNSGAVMMSGVNKWWQSSGGGNTAIIQAGPGVSQMVFTVLSSGTDHRLRMILQDNGASLNFIKNGDGYLALDATNTYTGQTIVNAGTLAIRNNAALGNNSNPLIVRSGATFDVRTQLMGMREVVIEGQGVGGAGALVNNNGTNGQTNAVRRLTLSGDATIGGTGRWDVRTSGSEIAEVNGGTFTLTKVGTNQISIVNPDHVNIGNIIINGGMLGFENKNDIMGDPNYTCTINTGGTLFLWNSIGGMTQNKPLILNGGTILGQNNPNTVNGTVRVSQNSTIQADSPLYLTSALFGPGGINKTGANVLTLSGGLSYTGTTTVTAGTLRVAAPLTATSQVLINGGFLATPGGADPAAALDAIEAKIAQGRNGGAWNGIGGISSATAAANVARTTGVAAVINNNGAGLPLRPTTSTDINEILVKYTYNGDSNIDGVVNADDYFAIDASFLAPPANAGWRTGDFDYNGVIDIDDYFLIDTAYARQGAALGDAIPSPVSAVPEPGTLSLLALGGAAMLGRRRRSR